MSLKGKKMWAWARALGQALGLFAAGGTLVENIGHADTVDFHWYTGPRRIVGAYSGAQAAGTAVVVRVGIGDVENTGGAAVAAAAGPARRSRDLGASCFDMSLHLLVDGNDEPLIYNRNPPKLM